MKALPSKTAAAIARRLRPQFPRAEVYQPLAKAVARVARGDAAESHPIDAAILAELRRGRQRRKGARA